QEVEPAPPPAAGWAGPGANLQGAGGKKPPAREAPPFEVGKKRIDQGPEPRRPRGRLGYRLNHLTIKNRRRRLNRRQLQFFLGFEVCVEPALAHPDLSGEVTDG